MIQIRITIKELEPGHLHQSDMMFCPEHEPGTEAEINAGRAIMDHIGKLECAAIGLTASETLIEFDNLVIDDPDPLL